MPVVELQLRPEVESWVHDGVCNDVNIRAAQGGFPAHTAWRCAQVAVIEATTQDTGQVHSQALLQATCDEISRRSSTAVACSTHFFHVLRQDAMCRVQRAVDFSISRACAVADQVHVLHNNSTACAEVQAFQLQHAPALELLLHIQCWSNGNKGC